MAMPYGVSNSTAKAAVKAAGYEGERIVYAVAGGGGWTLSSIDLFFLTYVATSTFKGASDAELVNNTHAICQYVATRGAALVMLAHTTAELTVDQWNLVFDVVAQYPEITVDSTEGVIATLKASPWTYVSETGISTRTWTDASNYHLSSSSPCIDTGTPVGLTSDYEGRPIPRGQQVDIGAYESAYPTGRWDIFYPTQE
jgi:hypothetical protein